MEEPMTLAAKESIRIAKAFFPNNLRRERDLAREIVAAINLCEADLAQDICRRLREFHPVGASH